MLSGNKGLPKISFLYFLFFCLLGSMSATQATPAADKVRLIFIYALNDLKEYKNNKEQIRKTINTLKQNLNSTYRDEYNAWQVQINIAERLIPNVHCPKESIEQFNQTKQTFNSLPKLNDIMTKLDNDNLDSIIAFLSLTYSKLINFQEQNWRGINEVISCPAKAALKPQTSGAVPHR